MLLSAADLISALLFTYSGVFFLDFCRLQMFFNINFFKIFFHEERTAWILNWPDILSGLIWVQTVFQRLSADNKIHC